MRTYPGTLPSKYAVLRVEYGTDNKHLYTLDDWGGVEFHPDRRRAEDAAQKVVEDDPRSIVAILKIEALLGADVKVKPVARAG